MKKIKATLLSTLISLIILSTNISSVYADTSYSPYGPYGPHIPVPTGIEDLDMVVLFGITLYLAGISLIVGSKLLKKNVN